MGTPGIDLFTYAVTILNLLDLRSFMGCLGSTHSEFMRTFRKTENFTVYFSEKRQSLLHPNTVQQSFFPITIFL